MSLLLYTTARGFRKRFLMLSSSKVTSATYSPNARHEDPNNDTSSDSDVYQSNTLNSFRLKSVSPRGNGGFPRFSCYPSFLMA